MASDQSMRAVVERIEVLVEEFARSGDPRATRNAQELVQSLMRLYGASLTRMLRIVELHEGAAGPTMRALLEDDLVASLLVLHDLHPEDVETRIRRGLERLQMSVGATLTLVEIREDAARVQVEDARDSTIARDAQGLIEGVIRALAPDVTIVEIAGLPDVPAPSLIQIGRRSPAERPDEAPVR